MVYNGGPHISHIPCCPATILCAWQQHAPSRLLLLQLQAFLFVRSKFTLQLTIYQSQRRGEESYHWVRIAALRVCTCHNFLSVSVADNRLDRPWSESIGPTQHWHTSWRSRAASAPSASIPVPSGKNSDSSDSLPFDEVRCSLRS